MKKEAERQNDSVLFEGMTSLNAVIKGKRRKIETVYFDEAMKDKKSRELAFIKRSADEYGFGTEFCTREYIEEISTGTSHGGIVFTCGERTISTLDAFTEDGDGISGFYVMIEGVEDPYNFGYALRSVYAAGAAGVILPERNWMSAAGVVCRASAGASELLPLYVSDSVAACEFFKGRGYKIVCAGIRDSVSAFDADLKAPLLLVAGGEKRGISSAVLSLADNVVRLDYGREFKGSLSTASAVSVLSYEVYRQNR